MFPDYLDNAKVFFFTSKGDYGKMSDEYGKTVASFSFLAICKYENDDRYYLFGCNADFEVEADYDCSSTDECMETAKSVFSGDIAWIAKGCTK